jgi:hypothetical protein
MIGDRVVVGGRYELGGLLGRGGMAEVRRAVDTRLGRPVAVKRLRADLAADSMFQARFRREAQSAAGLNHPAIVSVYDTGEEPDPVTSISIPYIVMEDDAARASHSSVDGAAGIGPTAVGTCPGANSGVRADRRPAANLNGPARIAKRRVGPTALIAALIVAILAAAAFGIYRAGLSSGQTVVPNVLTLSEQQARDQLTSRQLKVELKTAHDDKTKGTIVAQSPKGGVRVDKNSTVTITLNRDTQLSWFSSRTVPAMAADGSQPVHESRQSAVQAAFRGDGAVR